MSIKLKMTMVITLAFTVFFILLAILVTTLMSQTTEENYRMRIDERVQVFEKLLEDKYKQLVETAILASGNAESSTKLFEIAKVHDVEYIILCNERGEVVKIIKAALVDDSSFENECREIAREAFTRGELRRGFLVGSWVYMFASYPVYYHGDFVGYVATVEILSPSELERIRELVGVDVLEFLREKRERRGEISSYYEVRSASGETVGYFRLAFVNTIHPLVTKSFYTGLVISAFITFAAILITSTAIDRNVTRRVEILGNFMRNIKERGYYTGERIFLTGDDEIRVLADSINEALEEIERREKELRRVSENLRVVNRILRHDVLNDLTVIRGFAELGHCEGCKMCERIVTRVDQAVDAIERLKNVEEALRETELSGFRVSEVIDEVMSKFDVEWELKGDGVVLADSGIFSVFENLVSNAIRHGGTERVEFEVRDEGEWVVVGVADYGKGIPPQIRDRIFEEGFSTSGTGLGLYIVKKLVEKYGGEIRVSENEPRGAVFTIKLKKAEGEL
ncbi:Signal transduction histidine kinase [Geoglobus ahangari]|uniref:histidine kinase n=1 Tax=Geoglobus ahangari TaxID=113653 RepID=A0A0F7IG52_9EURY|nr:HAMP domain-containing sensor histidine kinase [Geoglobus ahangari]AKG92508.1 Signal transduction histidine kinase [Geoglobus ahangari]